MKLRTKKHDYSKRLLKINPALTSAQMAYRLKVFDEFTALRGAK